MAAQNTSTSGTGAAANAQVNRTRSVRNGAPVSARAAARKPATPDPAGDDDAKAELQARLDELQEKLNQAEQTITSIQKHADVLQIKLDEALKEQTILEDSVHEQTERVEELEHERKEGERSRREMEQIYEAERAAAMREKEDAMAREEEMQSSVVRLKEALQQREIRSGLGPEDGERSHRMSLSRTSSYRSNNNASPNPNAAGAISPDGGGRQFAPSSLQRSDSRSSSRLVMQKDKIIEDLRLELAEAQIKLVELENKGGGHVQLLEKDMYELKIQNARLMEENESFQLLLSEKTLNGDFTATSPADMLRAPSNQDSRPPSRNPDSRQTGASLADELDSQDETGSIETTPAEPGSAVPETKERRLQSEVNSLKDQNKALTLYINNIISRLLQHEQFEQILDKTPDLMAGPGAISRKFAAAPAPDMEKELPPPPPPKDERSASAPAPAGGVAAVAAEEGQQSLLQRAGSVLRGRGARPPRPSSQMIQPAPQVEQHQPRVEEPTVHENPETAPQIPLGRSRSTRGGQAGGHKRSNSDWPAASVVTNMYKGPTPSASGPMSPGLGSPTGRSSPFFPLGAGGRAPSGSSVPTISEIETNKENQPQSQSRDSQVPSEPRSNRNSVISNPADRPLELEPGFREDVSSNPSSPPRSTTSSSETRESRVPAGGAIMMGSKPRPLRLVQEAQDDEKAKKAANRGSWFGWMNKGLPGATGGNAAGGAGGMPAFMSGRSYSGEQQGQGGQ